MGRKVVSYATPFPRRIPKTHGLYRGKKWSPDWKVKPTSDGDDMAKASSGEGAKKTADPAITQFNNNSRKRNNARAAIFERLIAQPHIASVAATLWQSHFTQLSLATTDSERIRRLKESPSLKAIVLDLSAVDKRLVIKENTEQTSKRNRSSAKSERFRIGDNETTLKQTLREILKDPENRGATPSTLLPLLFARFKGNGCAPKYLSDYQKQEPIGISYDYEKNVKGNRLTVRRTIKIRTLQNYLTELRLKTSR
jgi:hypothetical protein